MNKNKGFKEYAKKEFYIQNTINGDSEVQKNLEEKENSNYKTKTEQIIEQIKLKLQTHINNGNTSRLKQNLDKDKELENFRFEARILLNTFLSEVLKRENKESLNMEVFEFFELSILEEMSEIFREELNINYSYDNFYISKKGVEVIKKNIFSFTKKLLESKEKEAREKDREHLNDFYGNLESISFKKRSERKKDITTKEGLSLFEMIISNLLQRSYEKKFHTHIKSKTIH